MTIRLKEARLTYVNLQSTFDECDKYEDFDAILKVHPRILQRWRLIL